MEKLNLENAYGQTPACLACCTCLLDGPTPDAELIMISNWAEDEE